MEKIKKTLVTLGLWLGIQIIVLLTFKVVSIYNHTDFNSMTAQMLLISDGLIAISLIILRYCKIREMFTLVPKKAFVLSLVMAISALFAFDMLFQVLDIPDIFEQQFLEMTKSWAGFIGICIVGPIMEEIMMRRVIMTEIAKATGHVWWGIIISAAIFSVIHGNPIQMVFALPARIIFGWLYHKTGSLFVPICIHIINNTISFFAIKFNLDLQISLFDTLGTIIFLVLTVISIVSIIRIHAFYSDNAQEEAAIQEEPAVPEEKASSSKGTFSGDNYEK